MKIRDWIKDHIFQIIIILLAIGICAFLFEAFHIKFELKILIAVIFLLSISFISIYDIARKKRFYDLFFKQLEALDKKYLITALDIKPSFLDGKLLKSALTDIDKSMTEHVNQYKYNLEELKDYIELWVHEVKIPLSGIELILHHITDDFNKRLSTQTYRIENCIEQVLYYVRAENAERDYLIRKCNLKEIVDRAIQNNKEGFLNNGISVYREGLEKQIRTDAKWLEFILGQLIQNSLQYNTKRGTIKISAFTQNNLMILEVTDNGI